jgi:hypothetical protein
LRKMRGFFVSAPRECATRWWGRFAQVRSKIMAMPSIYATRKGLVKRGDVCRRYKPPVKAVAPARGAARKRKQGVSALR